MKKSKKTEPPVTISLFCDGDLSVKKEERPYFPYVVATENIKHMCAVGVGNSKIEALKECRTMLTEMIADLQDRLIKLNALITEEDK